MTWKRKTTSLRLPTQAYRVFRCQGKLYLGKMGTQKIRTTGQRYAVALPIEIVKHPANSSAAESKSQRCRSWYARGRQQHNGLLAPFECNSNHQQILPRHLPVRTNPAYIYVPIRLCFGTTVVRPPFRGIRQKANHARNILLLHNLHHGMRACPKLSNTSGL